MGSTDLAAGLLSSQGQVREAQAPVLRPAETGLELRVKLHECVGEPGHLRFGERHPRNELGMPPDVPEDPLEVLPFRQRGWRTGRGAGGVRGAPEPVPEARV
jgi:hypothetical protein